MRNEDIQKVAAGREFVGAKIALICGEEMVTYLRDDFAHIPAPNMWDFAGGEAEPGETALDCALRETREEFGIEVPPEAILYASRYPSSEPGRADVAFFVAHIPPALVEAIRFGDEGQYWRMMTIEEFMVREDAVVALQRALGVYLESRL